MKAQPDSEPPTKNARLGPRRTTAQRVAADSVTTANVNAPAIAAAKLIAAKRIRAIKRGIESWSRTEHSSSLTPPNFDFGVQMGVLFYVDLGVYFGTLGRWCLNMRGLSRIEEE